MSCHPSQKEITVEPLHTNSILTKTTKYLQYQNINPFYTTDISCATDLEENLLILLNSINE
jgi:hypothetical protein